MGGPTACLEPTHVEFSWTEGGASNDVSCTGCVDETDIADNAVTTVKIAAGAVGQNEIATDGVGADEIGTDAVGSDEIATGAVGSTEILDGSITAADVDATSVQTRVSGSCTVGTYVSDIGSDGSVTCGADAAPSILGYQHTFENFTVLGSATNQFLESSCPAGTVLLSAGLNRSTTISVHDSHATTLTTWRYRVANSTASDILARVHLICGESG